MLFTSVMMKTKTQKSNLNHFMQLSIMVWLTLSVIFISTVSEAASHKDDAALQSLQSDWQIMPVLEENSGEEDPFDDALKSAPLCVQTVSGTCHIQSSQQGYNRQGVHTFLARGPPQISL